MIVDFWSDEGADWKYFSVLSLVQGLAITFGACLVTIFGGIIHHWHIQLSVSVGIMVTFGALTSLVSPSNKGMMIAFMLISVTGYGWAIFLSIAVAQMGVRHRDLGTSGGIAGVFRFAAGSIGTAVYTTILTKTITKDTAQFVPPAVIAAGLPQSDVASLLPLVGTKNINMHCYSQAVLVAAQGAYEHAQQQGIRMVALTSIAFGMIGFIATLCCKDVDAKMNNHTEMFLENDIHADLNEFHEEKTGRNPAKV